ncbi:hypothetical protein PABG_11784 [Paracoccidioides brasiliensis Pb03]|nr:hypothetical protein PABG_11784 [Paracoccidioides brasiliensis Pb03]
MEASLAALHQEFESAIQELCNQNQQLQAECQSLPAALNSSPISIPILSETQTLKSSLAKS